MSSDMPILEGGYSEKYVTNHNFQVRQWNMANNTFFESTFNLNIEFKHLLTSARFIAMRLFTKYITSL